MAVEPTRLKDIDTITGVRDIGEIVARYGLHDYEPDAVHALETVLSRARPLDLVWLEANARSVIGSYRLYASPWAALQPADVPRLHASAVRLASFHSNGRVREAAVRALACSDAPDVMPYLLFRANDWVTQVADAARGALEERLKAAHAASWIAALPYERHVRSLTRRAMAYLFDRARSILSEPSSAPLLLDALRSGGRELRRACVSLAVSFPPSARIEMLSCAMRDPDAIVAWTAANGLLGQPAAGGLREAIGVLLRHRVAKVRARALTALWVEVPAEAEARSREALFDDALCVREAGQFELKRHRGIGVVTFYLEALPHAIGQRLVATLSGIGEVGEAEHAQYVAPYVGNSSIRVQGAALKALARLDGDRYAPTFADVLDSRSPRLRRIGRESLRRRAHLVDRSRLESLLAAGGEPARAALTLLPQIDHWGGLLTALRAAGDPNLRETAQRAVERILARPTYTSPPDHAPLESALAAVRLSLPSATRVETLLRLTRPRS